MIHRFRVQNFKSLIDVTVDLSPVTVFVGKSGTGKSNFVQALQFLRDVLSSQKVEWNWTQISPATIPGAFPHFEVDFSIAGMEERFEYQLFMGIEERPEQELPFAKRETHFYPREERLGLGDKCLFHQVLNDNAHEWIVEPALFPVPEPGRIALGKIPSISEVVIAFTALTSGISCYGFSDRVLCDGPSTPSSTTGLNDAASNYLDVVKDITSNLQDLKIRKSIVSSLQRINPSVSSVELNNLQQPNHVVVGHKFNGKALTLPLSQESAGFRRFYAHLLALYQRPPKQTLIFEHPEDGIHPGALSLLAEEFLAAPEQGRGQVLLTTHSPRLLDHFQPEQLRVVELGGLATKIGHVSIEQQEALRENLLSPGELLTVDPARIQTEATTA